MDREAERALHDLANIAPPMLLHQVCERERERNKEGEGGRERKRGGARATERHREKQLQRQRQSSAQEEPCVSCTSPEHLLCDK